MNNFVSHLFALLLGIAITTLFLMSRTVVEPANPGFDRSASEQLNDQLIKDFESTIASIDVTDKDQIIEQQSKEIERLSKAVKAINQELQASLLAAKTRSTSENSSSDDSETELRTMNMQTFEESMKTQFTDQFKGVVLQLEGQRLEDIKQSFDNSNEKNEWSNQYENSIANFLANHDENGDHYLQSLNCNTNVCRLEVNTNDSENWNRLYAKMTNESWYQSITVQEKSEYPGNVIYYLPSLNN